MKISILMIKNSIIVAIARNFTQIPWKMWINISWITETAAKLNFSIWISVFLCPYEKSSSVHLARENLKIVWNIVQSCRSENKRNSANEFGKPVELVTKNVAENRIQNFVAARRSLNSYARDTANAFRRKKFKCVTRLCKKTKNKREGNTQFNINCAKRNIIEGWNVEREMTKN